MGNFKVGQQVGTWNSNGGQASITVKRELGSGYANRHEAAKAITKSGEQGIITQGNNGQVRAYAVDDGSYLDDLDLGEKVSNKAPGVLEFIGDDATELSTGKKFYPPTGPDNGKVFHIFASYNTLTDKAVFGTADQFFLSDDISRLQKMGYTVVADFQPTKQEFQEAMYDPRTAGFLWGGHGGGGYVIDINDKYIGPHDLDATKVSPNLKLAVFQACQVGQERSTWTQTLNQPKVVAWDENVSNGAIQIFNSRSVRSNAHALDNLVDKYLGGDFAKTKFTPDK